MAPMEQIQPENNESFNPPRFYVERKEETEKEREADVIMARELLSAAQRKLRRAYESRNESPEKMREFEEIKERVGGTELLEFNADDLEDDDVLFYSRYRRLKSEIAQAKELTKEELCYKLTGFKKELDDYCESQFGERGAREENSIEPKDNSYAQFTALLRNRTSSELSRWRKRENEKKGKMN